MKVFLTGGTGFIGRRLVPALLRRGWSVTVLVRKPDSPEAREIAAAGATLAKGDATDRESMRAPMRGADVVMHNAAWYEFGVSRSTRERMTAINVRGTENTLGLAAEMRIPRIVYTSTVLALGPTGDAVRDETWRKRDFSGSAYQATKAEAHDIALDLQQRGAPIVIVCPGPVIGPGDQSPWGWFARLWVRGIMPPLLFGKGGRHSLVHVDDVAETLALASEKGRTGETYLATGDPIAMEEIFDIWRPTPGGMKPLGWMPRPVAVANGALAQPLLRLLGYPAFLSVETVATSFERYAYSSAKARRELGARFRSQEAAWTETLAAERAAAGRG